MVTCETGYEQDVGEKLRSLKGVKETAGTIGSYDIIAKLEVSSVEALRELISLRIRTIEKVRTTTTIVCGQPY